MRLFLLHMLLQWTGAFVLSPSISFLRTGRLPRNLNQRQYISVGFGGVRDYAISLIRPRRAASLGRSNSSTIQGQKSGNSRFSETLTEVSSKNKAYVQEDDWSMRVSRMVFANSSNPVLLFDGVCNLCNDAVNLCLDLDRDGIFRYASLQSKVGQALLIQNGRDPDDWSTMVLVTAGKNIKRSETESNNTSSVLEISCYTGSEAVLRLASELHGLPALVRWSAKVALAVVPLAFRDAVSKFIGKNRHIYGNTDGPMCRLDLDGIYEARFLEDPDLL